MVPKLQYAFDSLQSTEAAHKIISLGVLDHVDVIEAGGGKVYIEEGNQFIRLLRKRYPKKEIVADIKLHMVAYGMIGPAILEAGADQAILMYDPEREYMKWVTPVNEKYKTFSYFALSMHDKIWEPHYLDVLLETKERHVIYRLNSGDMTSQDLKNIQKLNEMGFEVSLTGTLIPEVLPHLKEANPYSLIIGSYINNNEDPLSAVIRFREAMEKAF